ncbi:MAG: hypothetical protein KGK01_13190 [Bradyrhizobium sp.]|nr:hypothetical protein [Bradyrhizobium sp.]
MAAKGHLSAESALRVATMATDACMTVIEASATFVMKTVLKPVETARRAARAQTRSESRGKLRKADSIPPLFWPQSGGTT